MPEHGPLEESHSFSRNVIAYVHDAADRGVYDIRGLGAKRRLRQLAVVERQPGDRRRDQDRHKRDSQNYHLARSRRAVSVSRAWNCGRPRASLNAGTTIDRPTSGVEICAAAILAISDL